MTSLSIKIAIVIAVTTTSSSVAKTIDSNNKPSYPNNVAFLPRRGRQNSSNNNLLDDDEDIIINVQLLHIRARHYKHKLQMMMRTTMSIYQDILYYTLSLLLEQQSIELIEFNVKNLRTIGGYPFISFPHSSRIVNVVI